MSKSSNKNGFIIQAGILAAAGIICRIIGLLYRSPLAAVIGDEGNGYYQAAYNIYTMILLISSYSIPSAISKVIAQKLATHEYRNAHRVFTCAIYYVLIVGGLASLVLFFGAGFLTRGPAVQVVRVFAPTVFLYGLLGVLRGYFQAHRSMVQTSVSQIIEQILNAVVSIGAAYLLIILMLSTTDKYVINDDHSVSLGSTVVQEMAEEQTDENGIVTYVLSDEQQAWNTKHALYGAIGSALGTGSGVLIALLFMWAVYLLNKDTIYRRIGRDRHPVEEYGEIIKTITGVIIPFILSTAIYNLTTVVNQTVYTYIAAEKKNMENTEISTRYGIFSGKAVVISKIPIAISTAIASAILPTVSALAGSGDMKGARRKTAQAVKTTMFIAIPATVGIAVLARPITWLLFPQKASIDMASRLLMLLAVSIILYSLSTLTNSILQGIGQVRVPVKNAAVALVIQTAITALLLLLTGLDMYALVIAEIVYSGMMCFLNQRSIRRYMYYRQEIFKTFIVPFVASVFMGLAAYGTYASIHALMGGGEYPGRIQNAIALIPAILVGCVVYFVLEILFGGISEKELRELPKGYLMVKVAKKLHLM